MLAGHSSFQPSLLVYHLLELFSLLFFSVGFGGGGWAAGFTGVSNSGNSLQLQDEAKFNSLFPVAGFVTGIKCTNTYWTQLIRSCVLT